MMSEMPAPEVEGARIVAKVRRLMLISALFTILAVAAVLVLIGYRFLRLGESTASAPAVTATLPKGARIISTAIGEGRLIVTIEVAGAIEIRSYDVKTLKPMGALKFSSEP
jgi:hypothetical protein